VEFIHHSWWPLTYRRDHVYTPDAPHGHGKPVGFWISPHGEDDWAQWCLSESSLAPWRYRVTLDPGANILWISTGEQLDIFHHTYAVQTDFERYMEAQYPAERYGLGDDYLFRQWPIDWAKVAADYEGLIIVPYLWNHRLRGPSWYYGWDCASGCIWSTAAIVAVEYAPLLALKSSDGSESAIGSP